MANRRQVGIELSPNCVGGIRSSYCPQVDSSYHTFADYC